MKAQKEEENNANKDLEKLTFKEKLRLAQQRIEQNSANQTRNIITPKSNITQEKNNENKIHSVQIPAVDILNQNKDISKNVINGKKNIEHELPQTNSQSALSNDMNELNISAYSNNINNSESKSINNKPIQKQLNNTETREIQPLHNMYDNDSLYSSMSFKDKLKFAQLNCQKESLCKISNQEYNNKSNIFENLSKPIRNEIKPITGIDENKMVSDEINNNEIQMKLQTHDQIQTEKNESCYVYNVSSFISNNAQMIEESKKNESDDDETANNNNCNSKDGIIETNDDKVQSQDNVIICYNTGDHHRVSNFVLSKVKMIEESKKNETSDEEVSNDDDYNINNSKNDIIETNDDDYNINNSKNDIIETNDDDYNINNSKKDIIETNDDEYNNNNSKNDIIETNDEKVQSQDNVIICYNTGDQHRVSNFVLSKVKMIEESKKNETSDEEVSNDDDYNNNNNSKNETVETRDEKTQSQDNVNICNNTGNQHKVSDFILNIVKKVEVRNSKVKIRNKSLIQLQNIFDEMSEFDKTEDEASIDDNILQNIKIDFQNNSKVNEKIEEIKKNIIESAALPDINYYIIIKNSLESFLKSIVFDEVMKNQKLIPNNLILNVYRVKLQSLKREINKCLSVVDTIFKEIFDEVEEDDEISDEDEMRANSTLYVMSEKESFKEISIQITSDEDLNSKIPQDF